MEHYQGATGEFAAHQVLEDPLEPAHLDQPEEVIRVPAGVLHYHGLPDVVRPVPVPQAAEDT